MDGTVTRPLSHIAPHWELIWQDKERRYLDEEYSLGSHFNDLIEDISVSPKPKNYHRYMDNHLIYRSDIVLKNKIWCDVSTDDKIDVEMMGHYISQEAIGDLEAKNLILAAAGRIEVSRKLGFENYDELDDNHMGMLAQILTSILYCRSSDPSSSGRVLY